MIGDSEELWAVAEDVCTKAELDALRRHETQGYKRMAADLSLSISTVRGRIDRAEAKIRREIVARKKATCMTPPREG